MTHHLLKLLLALAVTLFCACGGDPVCAQCVGSDYACQHPNDKIVCLATSDQVTSAVCPSDGVTTFLHHCQ